MKRCSECGQWTDESEFWKVRRDETVLRARCRECCANDPRDHSDDAKPAGRICTACGEWKPLTEFHKHKVCRYGVEPMCKLCKFRKRKERDVQGPSRIRKMDLMAKYGLTLDDFNAMVEAQAGQCAICGTAEEKLVVDHNHTTGLVRGLLCNPCNTLIGYARESCEILVRAAAYLYAEQHPELGRVGTKVEYVEVELERGVTPVTAASVVTLHQRRLAL